MYQKYNCEEMAETSWKLNAILSGDISVETFCQFVNCELVLEWEGEAAEIFRNDLRRMMIVEEIN